MIVTPLTSESLKGNTQTTSSMGTIKGAFYTTNRWLVFRTATVRYHGHSLVY